MYSIAEATTVKEALQACAACEPALIVLDLGLPDGDGVEVLRAVRSVSQAPVLVHSGRSDESDKVALLDAGADDFVTKPVGEDELNARVRALLRRASDVRGGSGDAAVVEVEGLLIDIARERVVRDGIEQRLTPTECAILRTLLLHAGRTLTHQELWKMVWGREYGEAQLHLRVHITHLRRKIERHPATPALIVTEAGVGYRLVLP